MLPQFRLPRRIGARARWVLPALALGALATPAAAQRNSRLDQAMDRYWQATRDDDVDAAIDRLLALRLPFDSVANRLAAGRPYTAGVPRGLHNGRHRTSDGFDNHYTIVVPDSYDPARRYPVRFYLHGGTDTPDRRSGENWDAERFADSTRIAVFPSAWRGSRWWQASQIENLNGILAGLKQTYNIDENRVYVIGVSDGGIGAWFLGFRDPTPWAALLPFISSPEALTSPRLRADGPVYVPNLRNVPLFVVNGSLDPLYPARDVAADVALLRRAGVDVTFRPQPESGHDLRWWSALRPAIDSFIAAHPRRPLPDSVTWETERTDRSNRAYWVVIDTIGPVPGDHRFAPFDTVQPLPPVPSLGVRADPTSTDGVRIIAVELGSLGARAGFVPGDVITAVNGLSTPTMRALLETTGGASWGDTLRITVVRPGLIRDLVVPIPDLPDTPTDARVVFGRPRPTGRIEVRREGNTVEVLTRNVRAFTLLLSAAQFDLSRPVRVVTNGQVTFDGPVVPDTRTLLKWHRRDRDRTMLFAAELGIQVPAQRNYSGDSTPGS